MMSVSDHFPVTSHPLLVSSLAENAGTLQDHRNISNSSNLASSSASDPVEILFPGLQEPLSWALGRMRE